VSTEIKIEGDLDRGWSASIEDGTGEGAASYGHNLRDVLAELGSVIEVLSMRDRRRQEPLRSVPLPCNGTGLVPIGPGVRGVKACPGCAYCRPGLAAPQVKEPN